MRDRERTPAGVPETDKNELIETLAVACRDVLAWYLHDPQTMQPGTVAALKALTELEPECRAVFALHRFLDVSYTAIARRLGIRVPTVERHMTYALWQMAVSHGTCDAHEGGCDG